MSFVAGWIAVAGLGAALIPIAIHLLLRRRRTPILWAAMALLIEASRRQRRRARLEQLLLLALRCLLLIVAGLAIAQPLLGVSASSMRTKVAHFLIDDGVVSGAMNSEGQTALEENIDAIKAWIDSELNPGDGITITLASRPVQALVPTSTTDHRAVKRLLSELQSREGATDIAGGLAIISEEIATSPHQNDVRVYSAFRAGSIDRTNPPEAPITTSEAAALGLWATRPAEEPIENVQVQSITINRNPATATDLAIPTQRVSVTLRRNGLTPAARTRVRLEGDAIAAVPPRDIEWTPGRVEATLEFQVHVVEDGGVLRAVLDHDALPLDDERLAVVDDPAPLAVLIVSRASILGPARLDKMTSSEWIERALDPLSTTRSLGASLRIDRTDPASLDDRELEMARVVVLTEPDLIPEESLAAIKRFLQSGGVLLVTPPTSGVARPWASPLFEAIGVPWAMGLEPEEVDPPRQLAAQQPESSLLSLLTGELPSLAPSVRLTRRVPISGFTVAEIVLQDTSEEPVVLETSVGAGRFILFTVAPNLAWSDLPVRPLMVPLMHEIVRRGVSLASQGGDGIVGERGPHLKSRATVALLNAAGERFSVREGVVEDLSLEGGSYRAVDLADTTLEQVVVSPAVLAADVGLLSEAMVGEWLSQAGTFTFGSNAPDEIASSSSQAPSLAALLLMIAAVILLLETLLARLFSRANERSTSHKGVRTTRGAGAEVYS